MKISICKRLIWFLPVMICFVSLGSHALNCPPKVPGLIPVPDNDDLGTKAFCVFQYEAKAGKDVNKDGVIEDHEIELNGCDGTGELCDGGRYDWASKDHVPLSVATGVPWRRITRDSAINKCQKLNRVYGIPEDSTEKFDLISNPEWQTIARNIEKQDANWTGNKVGMGRVYQGNNGVEDSLSGYRGGGPQSGILDRRARHVLSNGKSIYHFPGNVWEWVKGGNNSPVGEHGQYMSEYSGSDYGPEGKNYSCEDCGFGKGWLGYSAGAVLRGGYWYDGDNAGLFAASLNDVPSRSDFGVGFRCVFRTVGSGS